jgi:hypothetical protein
MDKLQHNFNFLKKTTDENSYLVAKQRRQILL